MKTTFKLAMFPLLLSMVACGSNNLKHIEDTNGDDDYSLCSLSEREILSNNPHALFNVSTYSKDSQGNFRFTCLTFSGVSDILKSDFNPKSSETYEVSAKIKSGNGIFFIYQKGKMVQGIEWSDSQTIIIEGLTSQYSWRIAGESASMEIDIKCVN